MISKRLTNPIRKLSESGKLGGALLILATAISIYISNSAFAKDYIAFWNGHFHLAGLEIPILHSINDGLMVIFFFLVGLEIKREVSIGELAHAKKAMLPVVAAIGGMLMPALIFAAININDTHLLQGWAIPTATDIAFSLGVLSMLGTRVPFALKVFLTALAIIDDLGAIIIIALFYTEGNNFHPLFLAGGLALTGFLFVMSKNKLYNEYVWLAAGLVIWYCILESGIHATIAGVLIALTIPLNKIKLLEHQLHEPVNYFILPLFALANTAFQISAGNIHGMFDTLGIGIITGLLIGKPLGITLASFVAYKNNWCSLPEKINFKLILGAGLTAGIGFTMSIFIANLSFAEGMTLETSKMSIIVGSLLSGIGGLIYLNRQLKKKQGAASR